jgi:hypothetical protein
VADGSWSALLPCPVCAAQVADNKWHIEQHVTWHEATRTLGPKRGDYGTAQGLRAGFTEMRRSVELVQQSRG